MYEETCIDCAWHDDLAGVCTLNGIESETLPENYACEGFEPKE